MKKILFIAQRYPFPPNKGEKIRTYNQLKYLQKKNLTILISTPDLSAVNNTIDIPSITAFTPLRNKFISYGLGFIKNKPLSVTYFYSNILQNKIDKVISSQKIDAIICSSSSMAEYVFKSKAMVGDNKTKKPLLIMDFMDLDSDKWLQYSRKSNFILKWVYLREYKLLSKYEIKIKNSFDHCFFISKNEVDLFSKYSKPSKKVHVLGNGIDMTEFYPAQSICNNIAPIFLFTGVMDYKPNIDSVVWFVKNIWTKIIKIHPKSKFIIAGMSPTKEVQNLTKQSGVIVTGFVENILPFYHQSDYFIAPFAIARGVQNKILQAFSCGLPVISTRMGAEGIDCKDYKHLIIADSPTDFINAIDELEKNINLKDTIIKNALDLIKNRYSWEGNLNKLNPILGIKE